LTKLYEGVQRGTASDLLTHFQEHRPRGEYTLVIAPPLLEGSMERERNRG
jgi:16S rRNA (cytidine1402-2'-O)-methyltransferase